MLIKRSQASGISVRFKAAAGKENWKKRVLLIVDFGYECVHGTVKWGAFVISVCINLKTSLNICVCFLTNWQVGEDAKNPHKLLSVF